MRNIIRFEDLKQRRIINNWPALKKAVDNLGFPAGFMLTPTRRVWFEDEVMAWLESRPSHHDAPPPLKGRAKRLVERMRAREAASESPEA